MEDQRSRFKLDYGIREPAATAYQPGSAPVEAAPAHHGATHPTKPKKVIEYAPSKL